MEMSALGPKTAFPNKAVNTNAWGYKQGLQMEMFASPKLKKRQKLEVDS